MNHIAPKNWNDFQHYKDRSPTWIKLHKDLLDNREYAALSPLCAKYLPLMWLICSEYTDGVIPYDPGYLSFRLRIPADDAESVLSESVDSGFMVFADAESKKASSSDIAKANGFSSRYISKITKSSVFERDGGRCVWCGDKDSLEYDHIIPVSKGGGSDASNVQLLCRACNRAKRVKISAEQNDTGEINLRSLEKSREENINLEEKSRGDATASPTPPPSPKKGARLPDDWKPDDVLLTWAKNKRTDLNLSDTVESFCNYWQAKSGKDACKLDWAKTFKNWVISQKANPFAKPEVRPSFTKIEKTAEQIEQEKAEAKKAHADYMRQFGVSV